MTVENQNTINKNTLRVLGVLNRVDDALTRATFPLWRKLLALRGVELHKVESLGEQRALVRRIEPIIKGAVKIRIAEGDFSEGLLSEREWLPDSRIKVRKIPEGNAPEEFRRSWLGVELDAFKLPSSDQNIEVDLVSGQPIAPRKVDLYAVRLEEALQALSKKSPEAAEWFRTHSPSNIDSLTFAAKEVKVLKRMQGKHP
ncbi:MAG: hypothetical protein ABIJ82_00990 [Patescibacteria group bacterium]